MPLNEASHAEDLAVKGGKPPGGPIRKDGKRRKGWKGFYGSVHDIVCWYPLSWTGNGADMIVVQLSMRGKPESERLVGTWLTG
jgi:hypothetical protein